MQPIPAYKELQNLEEIARHTSWRPWRSKGREKQNRARHREPVERFVWAAIILAAGVILISSILLDHQAFAASPSTKDALVDIACPKCENFEDRRLQVTKDAEGTLTSLQFTVIKSGVSTGSYSPQEIKEEILPMYEQSGYTVVKLDARQVNPEKGGRAQLKWLGNVLLKSGAGSLTLDVVQHETGDWGIEHQGQRVRRLVVEPGSLGVEEVRVQY